MKSMEMEELEITIDPEGNVQVHVNGPKGMDCLETTKTLEAAVGDLKERSYTGEYYEEETFCRAGSRVSARER
jgi:hypothetical protein